MNIKYLKNYLGKPRLVIGAAFLTLRGGSNNFG